MQRWQESQHRGCFPTLFHTWDIFGALKNCRAGQGKVLLVGLAALLSSPAFPRASGLPEAPELQHGSNADHAARDGRLN